MDIFFWVIVLLVGVIVFLPLSHQGAFSIDSRYKHFKHVSYILALWWITEFLRYVSTNSSMQYYLCLLVYVIAYAFSGSLFVALMWYTRKKISKFLSYSIIGFLVIDAVVIFTNNYHNLLLKIDITDNLTYESFNLVETGIFFYIHTAVSYLLLLLSAYITLKFLIRRVRKHSDYSPLVFVIVTLLVGMTLNLINIFVYAFPFDPTYIVVIIFINTLYYVLYMRDIKLILGINRNNFILNNLREKYVITNEDNIVVDASKEFIKFFDFKIADEISFEELNLLMSEKAILYTDEDDIPKQFDHRKVYLNMTTKEISLPFYKYSGTFYLLFDNTANLKYIHGINYIKTHDLMTSLYNRNYLEEIRDNYDKNDSNYHIALIDIDGLKLYNDYLGHDYGDNLLIRFSQQLLEISNDDITPIRLGGDEFIVIFRNMNRESVEALVTNIVQHNNSLPILEKIQFSYGIVSNQNKKENMSQILKNADELMYIMKDKKSNYKELLEEALKNQKELSN